MNTSRSLISRFIRHLRRHGLAWVAIFLTLGGSAYALERGSVGTPQLKKSAVKTGKIANGAVTRAKLAANSVDSIRIANGSVTADKIEAGSIGTGKLAPGAVESGRIATGAVTREKLAPGAVNGEMVGLVSARADVDDTSANEAGTVKDIFTHGPFTIRARCTMKSNGWTWFAAYIKSTEKATSLALGDSPWYRIDANTSRTITANQITMNGGGTTAFPVNVWSESGRFLQVSVIATSRTAAAKDDCSYLITGFAG